MPLDLHDLNRSSCLPLFNSSSYEKQYDIAVRASNYALCDPGSDPLLSVEVDWVILDQSHIFVLAYLTGLLDGRKGEYNNVI